VTITEPLPVSGYGKANWVDYSNYWREGDAEWLMERTTLRYATPAARAAEWPTPKFGQLTYNEQFQAIGGGNYADRVEMYSKQHGKWVPLLMLDNITSTKDDATGVALSHKQAAGKGVIFEPTRTVMDNPIYVMGGVLTVDATGLFIKTGAKTVKLTTDGTSLVSDSPISATALSTGGALTAVSATLSASLTVANITLSGTLGGGVLNGTSGTIGGVAMGSNRATASDGFNVQSGSFYGDGSSAIMRHSNRSGSYVQVSQGNINFHGGGYTDVYNQMRIFGGQSIQYIRSDGVHTGYFAPTFWGDPGVGNVPEGSIMMQ
jgi:hypothetical protein